MSTAPAVTSAFSAVGDKNILVAPGGLISIYGTNLVKMATDLSGWAGAQAALHVERYRP